MEDFQKHAVNALRALVRDVESAFPWLDFTRDIGHLERRCKADPIRFCLADLPALGKVFDRWLSHGPFVGVPDSCVMDDGSTVLVDVFLFSSPLGEVSTVLTPDRLDPNVVLFIRQFAYFFKRTVVESTCEDNEKAAREFWDIDQGLRAHRSHIDEWGEIPRCGEFRDALRDGAEETLRRLVAVMDEFSAWLTPPRELDTYAVMPKHGPGAVSDLRFGEDKYTFPTWGAHLESLFPASYFAVPNEGMQSNVGMCLRRARAKLIAVPKSFRKPRLIASEPVVHQYLQQGLMRWLRENMHPIHRLTIDFNSQTPSREAALQASITGELATVDLSAASDRLSMWVVESFFRKHPVLLESLITTRSHILEDPLSKRVGALRKFAPMGSAVTFPVQSLVYATAAYAAQAVSEGADLKSVNYRRGRLKIYAARTRVFGDDIVLPRKAVPELGILLEYLELKVNESKTHYSGFFRESCGMDAYCGFDVTPAYVSHVVPSKPNLTLMAFIEQSNNAYRKGFWHLAVWMQECVRPEIRRHIPVASGVVGCVALTTYLRGSSCSNHRFSTRWHRQVVRGFFPRASAERNARDSWCSFLQWALERPEPDAKWASGWDIRRRATLALRWEDSASK